MIKAAMSSNFAAGAAGGVVRGIYMREVLGLVMLRALAGALSAYYVTPLVLWAAPRFLSMTPEELIAFDSPAGTFVSFFVGLSGVMLSTLVEKVLNSRLKI